jgi:hypothetical protein
MTEDSMEGISAAELETAAEILKDPEAREQMAGLHEAMIERGYHGEKTLEQWLAWQRAQAKRQSHEPPFEDIA